MRECPLKWCEGECAKSRDRCRGVFSHPPGFVLELFDQRLNRFGADREDGVARLLLDVFVFGAQQRDNLGERVCCVMFELGEGLKDVQSCLAIAFERLDEGFERLGFL